MIFSDLKNFLSKFEEWKGRHFYGRLRTALSLATPLEPSKRMTYWCYSGDSRIKKVGGTAGPRKKVGEPTNVSPTW